MSSSISKRISVRRLLVMHSGQLMNDLVDHMPYLTLRNLTVFPLHGLRNKEILYQMLFARTHKVAKLA